MNQNDKYWEHQLERYFDNELSDADLQQLREALEAKMELKDDFIFKQKLKTALKNQSSLDFLTKVKTIGKQVEFHPNALSSKGNHLKWWMGGIAFIILCVLLVFYPNQKTDNYHALHQNIIENAWLSHLNIADDREIVADGVKLYRSKEYQGAADEFEKYLTNRTNDNYIRFYQGMCYLYNAHDNASTENAINIFEGLVAKKDSLKEIEYEQLLWYLALAYIENRQTEQAEIKLQLILESSNDYFVNKAKTLIQLIENKR